MQYISSEMKKPIFQLQKFRILRPSKIIALQAVILILMLDLQV